MDRRVIVLIEDDEYIREAFCDALDSEGYSVHCFRNGQEAVEGLKKVKKPSLILLDWMMPVMNGEEFLRNQRESRPGGAPVVVVSAQADRLGSLAGVEACLSKPVDLDELLSTVKQYSVPKKINRPRAG